VSCSVHDVVRLERRGVPTVAVATRPFVDEAVEQAQSLGMPGVAIVYVPHPVQLLDPDALRGLADDAFPALVDGLTVSRDA
jgi:hypothetical protein